MADSTEVLASIRRRIGRGDLKPGDRVPSTRQITREWGVAMATATKVLQTLQQEGLVVSRPGIGTMVANAPVTVPPRPSRPRAPEVTLTQVVRTAMAIADAEGSAALSMRRVGTELGVATMSLYRHVPSKDDLVAHMIDAAFEDHPFTSPAPAEPRAAIEAAARKLWAIFRRHPWCAPMMSLTRPQVTPNVIRYAEWMMGALARAGLTPSKILLVHVTVFSQVRGLATSLEPEAAAQQETGMSYAEYIDTQGTVVRALADSFPTFRAVASVSDFDLDLDELFEFGLTGLLDGLAGMPGLSRAH